MKIFSKGKDGGPDSTVWGYWLIEWKKLFSIVLLKFEDGSRDVYHSHAFDAISWVLSGQLVERLWGAPGDETLVYRPSLWPIVTKKLRFHKVTSYGNSWVLSFRGPWADKWYEASTNKSATLTNGRKQI